MSDYVFMTAEPPLPREVDELVVRYSSTYDRVWLDIDGRARLSMVPIEAAALLDKLTAALNAYIATLTAVDARRYLTTPDAVSLANSIFEAMHDDWSDLMGLGS
ncbi:hypothetical protein [Nocardia sp. NPDC058705]|uniref:hypothetical protein n=1 Tax=Nocardia sp. NPDC058705 TaxID=3346609 RepID=UPI0036C86C8E